MKGTKIVNTNVEAYSAENESNNDHIRTRSQRKYHYFANQELVNIFDKNSNSILQKDYENETILLKFNGKLAARNIPLNLKEYHLVYTFYKNLDSTYECIMRWTIHNNKFWKINYSEKDYKETIEHSKFPSDRNALFAIYAKPVKIKEMDLVVENEICTQNKVACKRHKKFLSKVPIDYQVIYCNVNESGVRCKRKATLRCPV